MCYCVNSVYMLDFFYVVNITHPMLSLFIIVSFSYVMLHVSLCFCRLEEVPRPFPLHPCLRSPDEELRFLRSCARLLMLRLLPVRDARSRSLRLLLVEVVATKGDLEFLLNTFLREQM